MNTNDNKETMDCNKESNVELMIKPDKKVKVNPESVSTETLVNNNGQETSPALVEKTWEEFQGTGLLMFVNMFLHIFGWAITLEKDLKTNDYCAKVYRTKFRGFSEECEEKAYKKLTLYMSNNASKLIDDVFED